MRKCCTESTGQIAESTVAESAEEQGPDGAVVSTQKKRKQEMAYCPKVGETCETARVSESGECKVGVPATQQDRAAA